MIGQLRGIILEKQPPQLVLDIQGVGYEIDAPMSTFYHLPDIGHEVKLHIHPVIREDAHTLYGFYTQKERMLFRTLLKVNSVGPKLALTVLSSIEPDEFVRCITAHDTASLVRLPGVGSKTAERLIIEMRDKVSAWQGASSHSPLSITISGLGERTAMVQDAISALVALGYKPQEANKVVAKVQDEKLTSEEIIRCALRELSA